RIWDLITGKQVRRLDGHTGPVRCAVFSADGLRALSCGDDRTVRVWALAEERQVKGFTARIQVAGCMTFSADRTRVLLGGSVLSDPQGLVSEPGCALYDAGTDQELRQFKPHPAAVTAVALSADKTRALSGG